MDTLELVGRLQRSDLDQATLDGLAVLRSQALGTGLRGDEAAPAVHGDDLAALAQQLHGTAD
jgi:hypothetical protein